MTPEQQRIVIAEACGWKCHVVPLHDADGLITELKTMLRWVAPNEVLKVNPYWNCYACPDYLNDLNAMHEAEKLILNYDAGSHGRYIDHLIDVCGKRKDETWHLAIFHATAAQRAEAFLRTLNLWTHET